MKTISLILIHLIFISSLFADIETYFNGKFVQISWNNPEHIDIDYFIIEKSKNGSKFKEFQTIPATNNNRTKKSYYETDYTKLTRKKYYRIKYVDKNGSSFYSKISVIHNMKKKKSPVYYSKKEKKIDNYKEDDILVILLNNQRNRYVSKLNLETENEKLVATISSNQIPSGDYLVIGTSDDRIYGRTIHINETMTSHVYTLNIK